MDERWREMSRIFHEAAALPPAERAAFLGSACRDDLSLRSEVESLLLHDGNPQALRTAGNPRMNLIGQRIGVYEIQSLLGVGGMGEVYRARDTKLGRDVAVKVLPAEFAADNERLSRFHREARLLASLNHPHIGGIYEFEEVAGAPALVLELVEGETLADRTARGPMSMADAVPIAVQIADALAAAHDRGIIHRDLKPANIKITVEGQVKVLDFGLAKAAHAGGPMTTVETHEGMILGTVPYMSPEQARGQSVDKRTDIWAFGCVLYEMLSGRQAFSGDDVSQTIARVLTEEPDWGVLPPECPPAIRKLLRRCLAKDRRHRLSDAVDVRLELEDTQASAQGEAAPQPVIRSVGWRGRAAFSVAGAALAFAAALGIWGTAEREVPAITRFTITPPSSAPLTIEGTGRDLAISFDGRRVVYVAANGTQLVVHSLDQLAPTVLSGLGAPNEPFFSPDGQWIAYFDGVTALKKVLVSGGAPVTVSAGILHQNGGASWGEDDRIVFTGGPHRGLLRVAAAGGTPETLAAPDAASGEWNYTQPEVLPGAKALLFTAKTLRGDAITAVDLQTGKQTLLVPGASQAQYLASGYLVYFAKGSLWAVAFDARRRSIAGAAVPVAEGFLTVGGMTAHFALSRNGTLAYVPQGDQAVQRRLVWVDRRGSEQQTGTPARAYVYPRLSPDGTRIAVAVADQANDIWMWNVARKTLDQFTFGDLFDLHPVWTCDGQRVIWGMVRATEPPNIYWQSADGTGSPQRVIESALVNYPLAVTPDGRSLLFRQDSATTGHDLAIVALNGEKRPVPLIATKFNERNGEISPDGRWIAYESNESGTDEVYVRPFPAVESGLWVVSHGGGRQPLWSRNGRELFFRTPDGGVMGMPVHSTGTSGFSAGTPAPAFGAKYYVGSAGLVGRTYDVSPDANQFLMIKAEADAASRVPRPSLVVVQNWVEELKQKLPIQ